MDEKDLAQIEAEVLDNLDTPGPGTGRVIELVAEVRRQRALVADARALLADREWFHRNAALNAYCPSCEDLGPNGLDRDIYEDQVRHYPACLFVAFMRATEPKA